MSLVGLKLTVPAKRFLIDIETSLDGEVTIKVVQAKPLRLVDSVVLKGQQLDSLQRLVSTAWESK